MAVITSSPTQFGKLLEIQNTSLGNLVKIKEKLESKNLQSLSSESAVAANEDLVKLQKEQVIQLKKVLELRDEEIESITKLASGMKTFETFAEKLTRKKESFKESFSGDNIRMSLMKKFNAFGILNKSIERESFIKQQKAIDPSLSRDQIKKNFEGAYKTSKEVKSNEAQLQKFKADTGLSEEELARTQQGKALLEKRKSLSSEYTKYDAKAKILGGADLAAPSDETSTEEQLVEEKKMMDDQTNVLKTIAENTDPKKQKIPVPTSDQNKKTEDDAESGGMLGKMKDLMKGMGKKLGSVGGAVSKLGGAAGLGGVAAMGGVAALIGGLVYAGFRKDSQIAETKAEADVKKSELDKRLQDSAATVEESAGSGLSKEDKIFTKDHKGLAQIQDEAQNMKNMSEEDKIYKQIKDYETNSNEGQKLNDKQLAGFEKTEEGKKAVAKYKNEGGAVAAPAKAAEGKPADLAEKAEFARQNALADGASPKEANEIAAKMMKYGSVVSAGQGRGDVYQKPAESFDGINSDTADLSANRRNPDVYGKSAENFAGSGESFGGNDNSTTVVNAPVNNTTKQINTVPTPIRNQEASVNSYLRGRYT